MGDEMGAPVFGNGLQRMAHIWHLQKRFCDRPQAETCAQDEQAFAQSTGHDRWQDSLLMLPLLSGVHLLCPVRPVCGSDVRHQTPRIALLAGPPCSQGAMPFLLSFSLSRAFRTLKLTVYPLAPHIIQFHRYFLLPSAPRSP